MEKNTRKFIHLIKTGFFDLKDYFTFSIWSGEIHIQGHYNSELVKKLMNKKFKSQIVAGQGWIKFNRSNIEIILS